MKGPNSKNKNIEGGGSLWEHFFQDPSTNMIILLYKNVWILFKKQRLDPTLFIRDTAMNIIYYTF